MKGDSRLTINTLADFWKIHKPHLRALYNNAKDLERKFARVGYQWIPREENTEADALSRQAYKQG